MAYTTHAIYAGGNSKFLLGCLAHAPYLVSSQGIAAVIDPQRDVEIATSLLRRAGLRDVANLTGGFDAWKAMSSAA